jgi:hypothetical protein
LPSFPDEQPQNSSLQSIGTDAPNLHDQYIPPGFKDYEQALRIGHTLLLPTQLNKMRNKLFL